MSILNRFSLENCTALVTGSGRGIGAALARGLAESGADVAVADLDLATAELTARDLDALVVRSMAIQVDVTIAKRVHQMVKTVIAAWGQLDVAVNSAGIAYGSPAEELKEDAWDAVGYTLW
jgi:gluconate 5-dehydrogenase